MFERKLDMKKLKAAIKSEEAKNKELKAKGLPASVYVPIAGAHLLAYPFVRMKFPIGRNQDGQDGWEATMPYVALLYTIRAHNRGRLHTKKYWAATCHSTGVDALVRVTMDMQEQFIGDLWKEFALPEEAKPGEASTPAPPVLVTSNSVIAVVDPISASSVVYLGNATPKVPDSLWTRFRDRLRMGYIRSLRD